MIIELFLIWYWWKTPCVTVWHNRSTILIFFLFEYLITKKDLCSSIWGETDKPNAQKNLGFFPFLNDLIIGCWKFLVNYVILWRLELVKSVFSHIFFKSYPNQKAVVIEKKSKMAASGPQKSWRGLPLVFWVF